MDKQSVILLLTISRILLSVRLTVPALFLTLSMVGPVAAVNYTAYPGSTVVVTSIKGKITGSSNDSYNYVNQLTNLTRAFLGGLIAPDSQSGFGCLANSQVKRVDGWTGVLVSNNDIVAGMTGTVVNAVANYQLPNSTTWTRVSGGLIFDAFGAASGVGDVTQDMASNRLCGGITVPGGTKYTTPGNSKVGNVLADIDLKTWIYVPVNTPPGTYNLKRIGIVQGSTSISLVPFVAYLPIINTGDTVEVLAPPCTIRTQTSIVFDTTSEAGMKVSAPIVFECGQLNTASNLEAFLQIRPLNTTASDTEMNLTIDSSKPGGVVRSYAGQGLTSNSVNCHDNNYSISYTEAFASKIGNIISNSRQETPLYWQLCRKGNEAAGLATGSAILSINYK